MVVYQSLKEFTWKHIGLGLISSVCVSPISLRHLFSRVQYALFENQRSSNDRIDEEINADDSQLALICYRNGYRAIMHDAINFTEPDSLPTTKETEVYGELKVLFVFY